MPQTPAALHAEAVTLLNEATEYPVNSAAFLGMNTRAAAFASLALYRPEKAPRRPAPPKAAPEAGDA